VETVLETNDLVLISFVRAVLQDAAIDCIVLDQHMSAMDGSIGAIPRRLCVSGLQADRARELVKAVQDGDWRDLEEEG
jgi:hypothetical protein